MPDGEASGPRYGLGSVDLSLRLLLLLKERPTIRVTTAARDLGIASSTAHRLLTTLAHRGFVAQDRVSKEYRLGPAVFELGAESTATVDLREMSEPHLRDSVVRLGETVSLIVREGDSVRFIAGFESDQRVRTHVLTGTLLPAYATSGGKLLLAELPRDELRRLYPRGLRKLTPQTKTFTGLVDELALIMMRGYAVNDQESVPGLAAIAVPLRNRAGQAIAGVAMSAPSERMTPARVREVVIELRDCAAAIRASLARRARADIAP